MNKITFALLATVALTVPAVAFADDTSANVNSSVEYKDNGGYTSKATASQTDANGTTKSAKKTEDVNVDSNGNTTKKVTSVQTVDPKGLGNETKNLKQVTVQDKSNGGYKKTVETKSTNPGSTPNVTAKSSTDVNVDKNGNVIQTTEASKTVDPKTGLFSAKTTTSKTKTVNGQVVDQSTSAPNPAN